MAENSAITDAMSPVRDTSDDAPREGIALCLSGGGYRAMVFHIGVLWRLNELGLLPVIKRYSSVSGGSITAGVLAMNWDKLGLDDAGVARNFVGAVVEPLRKMAGTRVDAFAVVTGSLLPGKSVSERVADAYRRHLFSKTTLQDLPTEPRFVFNATNLESGKLWRFSKPYTGDYRVGRIMNPKIDLAVAVAASSAFPPVLSPCVLDLKGQKWHVEEPGEEPDLTTPEFRDEVTLSDGGVYDNLGLETAWPNYQTILVSDAGGALADDPDPPSDWARHTLRVMKVIDGQVRALRKRQVIGSIVAKDRKGMYVGIRSNNSIDFPAAKIRADFGVTTDLAEIGTRLDSMKSSVQEQLINWGYVACDGGLRSYAMRDQLRDAEATPLPYTRRPLF